MAPPITSDIEKQLYDLYYNQKFLFGRDKFYARTRQLSIPVSRRQVWDWLSKQETNQVYRPIKPTTTVQATVLDEPYKQIGIDLVDMRTMAVAGYTWLLNAIDLFSKKGWSVALKDKTDNSVLNGMKVILGKINHPIKSIRSDNGSEFKNAKFQALMKKEGIKQVFSLPYTPQSNGQVEKFNGVLKGVINKARYNNDEGYNWVKDLDVFVDNYNNSINATTNKTPNDIAEQSAEENSVIRDRIYKRVERKAKADMPQVQKGDKVRVLVDKTSDELPKTKNKWSVKLYEVESVRQPQKNIGAVTYSVKGLNRRLLNNQIQKVNVVENERVKERIYVISKLVRPAFQKGVAGYWVRWKGYKPKDDTFESRTKLEQDVPKILAKYEKDTGIQWDFNRKRYYMPKKK